MNIVYTLPINFSLRPPQNLPMQWRHTFATSTTTYEVQCDKKWALSFTWITVTIGSASFQPAASYSFTRGHAQEPRNKFLKPTMTLEHPRDIHYYVNPVPRPDYDPWEHANRPVEIHYHLPPQSDTQHTKTDGDDHYHVYLPQQKQVRGSKKKCKKTMNNKVGEELKGLLDQFGENKRSSNVQGRKQYQQPRRLNTGTQYGTPLLSRQAAMPASEWV